MDSMSKIAKLQGYVYDHLEIDNEQSRVTRPEAPQTAAKSTDAETATIVSAPGRIERQRLGCLRRAADGHYRA